MDVKTITSPWKYGVPTKEEFDALTNKIMERRKVRNTAEFWIKDAIARYVKKKSAARSKKAATEKDALLKSKKFEPLTEYSSKQDIIDAYGWGVITESMCDRLQSLWDEREELKRKVANGVYTDPVTECLNRAIDFVRGIYMEDEEFYMVAEHDWRNAVREADAFHREEEEKFKAWKNGWGEYAPKRISVEVRNEEC